MSENFLSKKEAGTGRRCQSHTDLGLEPYGTSPMPEYMLALCRVAPSRMRKQSTMAALCTNTRDRAETLQRDKA